MALLRLFDSICSTGIATAGYTSELCGEWGLERFSLLAGQFGLSPSDIVFANEKHTDKIRIVDASCSGSGVTRPHCRSGYDAMLTDCNRLMMCINTADCVPLVLLDPVKKVAGIVHSGWMGCAERIAGKAIRRIIGTYGSNPHDIICAMGPYNHSCCYEVGAELVGKFRGNFSDGECNRLFRSKGKGKFLLDMGEAVSIALIQEGVLPENITDSGLCTYHTTEFSSWRRTQDYTKQMVTFIFLDNLSP